MGSYFHVIERKVGGNLDAFRRELGRLRESGHFHRDRHERIMRIAKTVGFGHIVRQCLVDTGHRAGCEVHVLTSTGIVLVFMENWDEAEEKDPRIWRYTFDGEKMHVQDGRFVFD